MIGRWGFFGRGMLAALLALACAVPAQAEDSFQRFRSLLIDYFQAQGFLPVLVDRGYRIGDVVNADGINLYARGTRCFPHLVVPRATPTSLADVVSVDTAGMSFSLYLRQIFSSDVGGDLARRINISFTDVSVRAVTLLDLRDALDRKACPEIAPLIDGTLAPVQPGEQPFFVVSEVLTGKRQAHLEFSARANMAAQTQKIAQLAASAKLSVQGGTDGTVTLANETVQPIAIMPVTVPHVVQIDAFKNGLRGGTVGQQVRWQPAACDTPDSCTDTLGSLADPMKSVPVTLSAQDLDR
jgi:hypothetical protein